MADNHLGELTDWFMVRGTAGIGLDYRNLDVKVSGYGNDSERNWDCYMICGLGGMFHWKDICLGADFLDTSSDSINPRIAAELFGRWNAAWAWLRAQIASSAAERFVCSAAEQPVSA